MATKKTADKQQTNTKRGRWAKGESGNPSQKWKPGKSANPKGRPKSIKYVSEAAREWFGSPSADHPQFTNAEAVVAHYGEKALGGDLEAAAFLLDRAEGKAPSRVDLKVDDNRDDTRPREEAHKLFASYVEALDGDEAKARKLFAEDVPTLSRYVN